MDAKGRGPANADAKSLPAKWDREADVVVIGSGATGLPAAIVAREAGASVILVEAEKDIGGHAIISGGNVPLGGGTSVQKKYGIEDSPGPAVPRSDRLVGGRAQRLPRLPLQRSRDHSRLRRQQRRRPSNGWSRTASSSSTRRPMPSAATRSAIRCRAKCTAPSWIGRWRRPASRPIRRCKRPVPPATA